MTPDGQGTKPRLGPVAQQVKSEYSNTTNEFRNLANARNTRPSQTAGTGQPLTRTWLESPITAPPSPLTDLVP